MAPDRLRDVVLDKVRDALRGVSPELDSMPHLWDDLAEAAADAAIPTVLATFDPGVPRFEHDLYVKTMESLVRQLRRRVRHLEDESHSARTDSQAAQDELRRLEVVTHRTAD